MNERIQKLAEQATNDVKDEFGYWINSEFDKEKFAELIVAHATECVRDVLRDEKSDLSYAAASQVQDRIKQYFGVEE